MTDTAETRLRLSILGGFLGSGKTTWLRHQLHAGRYAGAHLLVNEAAGTAVDDALLGSVDQIEVLAGGCACCSGQESFRASLRALCDRRSAGQTDLRQIVLETSGLADPAAIVALIQSDPVLTRHIVLSEVIVLVDALHGASVLGSETLGIAQVEAADRLILTKTDEAPPEATARLCRTLQDLAPGAAQSAAVFGSDTPLPVLPPETEPLDLGAARGPAPAPIQIDLGDSPDWTALTVWLSCLLHARGDQILRGKGVVRTPAGRLLLQSVRRVVQSPERLPDSAQAQDNTLILIGRDMDATAITRSFAALSDPA